MDNDETQSQLPARHRKTIVLRRDDSSRAPKFRIAYETELTAAQFAAVELIEGPALVVAGAGTGKTRTLIYRVARMIESGIPPEHILLLTFTRKSAQEMMRRASMLVGSKAEQITGGTFHAFANATLRKYADKLDYDRSFSILDQGDFEDTINLLRAELGFDAKARRFPRKQTLAAIISASVNRMTLLKDIVEQDYPQFAKDIPDIESLARRYQDYKRRHNVMDYDDLLVNLALLVERHPDIRDRLSKVHKYIMVDEYQDTNALQHQIVHLLASSHRNIMVVGDDSQSIYSFRGANFRNIMDFPKMFPDARVITIEENFRSNQPILNVANAILQGAVEKHEKVLFTRRVGGSVPMIVSCADEQLQSQFIAQQVLELREQGIALADIAVLFRSGYHSFDLEIELNKTNIPFVKFGGFKFMETAHVKDLVAHLRVLSNPRDVVSWNRIVLLLEGIGPRSAKRILEAVTDGSLRLNQQGIEVAKKVGGDRVARLVEELVEIQGDSVPLQKKVDSLIAYYMQVMTFAYKDDYQKRMKDVETFAEIAARYRSLNSLLADMALEPPTESVTDIRDDAEDEYLTLSTIHSAKGLEWRAVFIMHAVDGRFPSHQSADSIESMEEERRLMYVAVTRAKEYLTISYPTNLFDRESGVVLSKPSRFIQGVPEDVVERWAVMDEEEDSPDLLT